ncbi:glycosyltransferase [Planktomarina temperata]|nr:glycosyltransferase [Planktomarina temperata]
MTYVVRTERIKTQWIKRGLNQDSIIVLPSTIIDPTENINACRKFVGSPIELLIFGQIRKGKSIERVIDIMHELNGFKLTICGPSLNDDYAYELSQLVSQNHRVSLDIGFQDTEEVNNFFLSSDFLLVLYDDDWDPDMESGIVHLAVQYQKPIICFDGCWIADVTREYDLGYILSRKDPLACQLNKLRVNMTSNELIHLRGINRFMHELGTAASVEKLLHHYRSVLR